MKKSILPIFILLFILSSIISTSCVSDAAAEELAFQQAVDTLFNRQIKSFKIELDSLCELQMDSMIRSNMDSIKQLRLQEIEELIKKQRQ